MSIVLISQIDEIIEQFKIRHPLCINELHFLEDLKDLRPQFKKERILEFERYLNEISLFVESKEYKPYLNYLIKGVKEIRQKIEKDKSNFYFEILELDINSISDYDLQELKREGMNRDGYEPFNDEEKYEYVIQNCRSEGCISSIKTFHYLYTLLIVGMDNLISNLTTDPISLVPVESDFSLDNDNKQVDDDQPINYKIHLLHSLGFLEPLNNYYKEKNPHSNRDDFAGLIGELLDPTAKIGTIKRVISSALKNEELGSYKLKQKLSKTLKDHNLEDTTRLGE